MFYRNLILLMLFIFSPVVAMNSPVMILVQQQTSSDLQAEFVDDKDAGR